MDRSRNILNVASCTYSGTGGEGGRRDGGRERETEKEREKERKRERGREGERTRVGEGERIERAREREGGVGCVWGEGGLDDMSQATPAQEQYVYIYMYRNE